MAKQGRSSPFAKISVVSIPPSVSSTLPFSCGSDVAVRHGGES